MLLSRYLEELGPGDEFRQPLTRTGNLVLGADRDQDRRADRGEPLRRDRCARTAHAGGKRLQVGARLLGEFPVDAAGLARDRVKTRRLERGDDLVLTAHPL